MTNILFKIGTIYPKQFNCTYLKHKKFFLNFLLHFWNLHKFLNIFKKKMTLIGYVIEAAKDLVN